MHDFQAGMIKIKTTTLLLIFFIFLIIGLDVHMFNLGVVHKLILHFNKT